MTIASPVFQKTATAQTEKPIASMEAVWSSLRKLSVDCIELRNRTNAISSWILGTPEAMVSADENPNEIALASRLLVCIDDIRNSVCRISEDVEIFEGFRGGDK